MRITSISPQKQKDRVNIFIDGEFAFGISLALRFENKVNVGQELTEIQIQELIEKDQTERLLNSALKFLSYRPRSEKEVKDQLNKKIGQKNLKSDLEKQSFERSKEKAIRKLKDMDLVNDKSFSKWWVDQRSSFKSLSHTVVRGELIKKGISKDLIDEILVKDPSSELENAKKAANTKLRSYSKLDEKEFRLKMGAYLARKGFNWEVIKKVVDSLSDKELK